MASTAGEETMGNNTNHRRPKSLRSLPFFVVFPFLQLKWFLLHSECKGMESFLSFNKYLLSYSLKLSFHQLSNHHLVIGHLKMQPGSVKTTCFGVFSLIFFNLLDLLRSTNKEIAAFNHQN